MVLSVLAACSAPPAAPPTLAPEVHLEAPWRVEAQDAGALTVRRGDEPMGVRIGLREPGVTPIHRGRPLRPSPMVEPLWAPVRVEVLSEGPDLVARFYGPPLSAVSRHPDAPEDPVHTWVRLRPRPDDWRVVLTGLGRVNLPAGRVAPTSTGMHLDASPDAFEITVETPVTTTLSADRWTLDTRPALEDHQPYPRVGISWRR